MKVKTSELTGAALDWAVAIIEFPKGSYGGEAEHYSGNNNERWIRIPNKAARRYDLAKYSTDWAQAGPIIEREGCFPSRYYGAAESRGKVYQASAYNGTRAYQQGDTPLIAAMRCYVASQLGDEVDIPEELV